MKDVLFFSSTRADYGLFEPIAKACVQSGEIRPLFLVSGGHLAAEQGLTYTKILEDGYTIACSIDCQVDSTSRSATTKSMSILMAETARYLEQHRPEALIVLGDRVETLAVCTAAMNELIPLVHIHGGETTEGAVDEAARHAITKMSFLHFTSTEVYRQRVIQLGEDPDRVFNVGAVGVENIKSLPLMSQHAVRASLALPLAEEYAVCTYHPETLSRTSAEDQIRGLLAAFAAFPQIDFLVTGANIDVGGSAINALLQHAASQQDNVFFEQTLGNLRYLSAAKHALFVIGNSSSGIIEVPSLGVPVINIGDRQKGRVRSSSVIDCAADEQSIVTAIERALSPQAIDEARSAQNPYDGGKSSEQIVSKLLEFLHKPNGLDLAKSFYDLPQNDSTL